MESFILFYEKCRLCLDRPGVCNMFAKEDLPDDIYLCTGVRVHPSDNLPQKICDGCNKVITSAKELRTLAAKNNTHLRSLFMSYDDDDDDEPRLQIDEGDITSSGSKSLQVNDKDQATPTKQKTDSSEKKSSSSSTKRQISVRKDLLETSTNVTSSTKCNTDTMEPGNKKIKLVNVTIQHECTECQKTFDTSKKLYLHQRMHTKSVVCPLDACNKRFATKGDLEKHFRTHTGEKPFPCPVCGKGFAQRVTLKAHRAAVHGRR